MKYLLPLALTLMACAAPEPDQLPGLHIEGDTIPAALDGAIGDAARGEMVFTQRESGHCVLCHAINDLEEEFQGNVGPSLDTVGGRLSAGQIRLRIVDISLIQPDTAMPPYFRTAGLHQVAADYSGQTVLSSQDIEDLVAYLSLQID